MMHPNAAQDAPVTYTVRYCKEKVPQIRSRYTMASETTRPVLPEDESFISQRFIPVPHVVEKLSDKKDQMDTDTKVYGEHSDEHHRRSWRRRFANINHSAFLEKYGALEFKEVRNVFVNEIKALKKLIRL